MVRCSGVPSNPVSTTGRVIVPFSSTGSLEPSNRNIKSASLPASITG